MKYNDNGEYKDIYVKAFDTLPVGTQVNFNGTSADIPDGWEQVGTSGNLIIIEKTSQYIEGGATLSNEYGTSQTNGYSQEYLNNILNDKQKSIKTKIIAGRVQGSGTINFDYSSITGTIIGGFIVAAQNTGTNSFITNVFGLTYSYGTLPYPTAAVVTSTNSTQYTYVSVLVLYTD